jgi:hypothetical protein
MALPKLGAAAWIRALFGRVVLKEQRGEPPCDF